MTQSVNRTVLSPLINGVGRAERGRLPFTALLPRSWMADDLEAVRSASAKLAQGLISEEEYRHILKVGTRVLFVHLCNELAGEPKNASDLVITLDSMHGQKNTLSGWLAQ
jgi:hypothetical protein